MKADEIRIGNWVVGDMDGMYQFELSDFHDWYNDHNSHEFGDHIHPIPLTEEWLLKFGFKKGNKRKDIGTKVYNKQLRNDTSDTLTLRPYREGGYIWGYREYLKDFPKEMGSPSIIKHVHQLQNLYFALTEEELEDDPR